MGTYTLKTSIIIQFVKMRSERIIGFLSTTFFFLILVSFMMAIVQGQPPTPVAPPGQNPPGTDRHGGCYGCWN